MELGTGCRRLPVAPGTCECSSRFNIVAYKTPQWQNESAMQRLPPWPSGAVGILLKPSAAWTGDIDMMSLQAFVQQCAAAVQRANRPGRVIRGSLLCVYALQGAPCLGKDKASPALRISASATNGVVSSRMSHDHQPRTST